MIYTTTNGTKPRYDGGGTEFGLMHRDLGPGYLMFDIDRMSAQLDLSLEMRRENEGWIEYRRIATRIAFVALFEVKHSRTQYSEQALNPSEPNSMARFEMAKRLDCRLFVVFATRGQPPFEFYEIDKGSGEPFHVGTLDYTANDRMASCRAFWRDMLGIARDQFS